MEFEKLKLDTIDGQIEAYISYCQKTLKQSESTLYSKRYILKRFVAQTKAKDMREVDNRLIDWWIGIQRTSPGHKHMNQLCSTTVKNRLQTVRVFIAWLEGLNISIPVKVSLLPSIKRSQPTRVWYTADQIEEALKFANEQQSLMIRLAFEAGLRLSELRFLKVDGTKGREIMVFGKGSKWRKVCITRETLVELLVYIKANQLVDDDYLWPQTRRPKGQRRDLKRAISKYALSMALAEPFKLAGFDDFHPHALRHSFATNLQINGAPTEVIKELMGHDDIRTTGIYLHRFELGKIDDYDRWWKAAPQSQSQESREGQKAY